MKSVILFILFFSFNSFAQKKIDSVCPSEAAIAFTYLNGVDNTTIRAEDSKKHIRDLIEQSSKIPTPGYTLDDYCYKYIYNQTEGKLDFIEVLAQKIREANPTYSENQVYQSIVGYLQGFENFLNDGNGDILDDEFRQILIEHIARTEYETLHIHTAPIVAADLKERSVLLVSHSQGNLFANLIYQELQRDPSLSERMDKLANLQIGSAASHIAAKNGSFGDYVTAKQDLVIQGLGELGQVLSPNVELSGYLTEDPFGHGFIEVYTNKEVQGKLDGESSYRPMSELFLDKLSALAKKILKPVCVEDVSVTTYVSQVDIPDGKHFIYPVLENPDGTPFTGNASDFKLMALTKQNTVLEILDEAGEPINLNRLSYIDEGVADHNVNKYFLVDKEAASLGKDAVRECLDSNRPPLVSFYHRDKRAYIDGIDFQYNSVLVTTTAGDVVKSVTFNGKQLEFLNDCYNKQCHFSSREDEMTLPGTLNISLESGQGLTLNIEAPLVSSFQFSFELSDPIYLGPGPSGPTYYWKTENIFFGSIETEFTGKTTPRLLFMEEMTSFTDQKILVEANNGFLICGKRYYVFPEIRYNQYLNRKFYQTEIYHDEFYQEFTIPCLE